MDAKITFVLLMLLGFTFADVIPLGYHSVTHHLYIDNIDEYSNYTFFIYPTSMSGGATVLDSDKIPGFYKFAMPKLYAVPVGTDLGNISSEDFEPPADALVSEELERTDTLPDTDTRTEIETHYNLSIEGDELILTELPGEGPQQDYCPLTIGLAVALLAGCLAGNKL